MEPLLRRLTELKAENERLRGRYESTHVGGSTLRPV
jgi:hypothetical protein